MDSSTNSDKLLSEINEAHELIGHIELSLVSSISACDISIESKVPLKIVTLHEALKHRVVDIGKSACEFYIERKYIQAIILARAVMESSAAIFYLYYKLDEFMKDKDIYKFDEFIMRCLLGQRIDNKYNIKSINIMTMIEKTEKQFNGFLELYNDLCEYTHPNWSGVMGFYSTTNRKKHITEFSSPNTVNQLATGLPALKASLLIVVEVSNIISEVMGKVIKLCNELCQKQ